MKKISIVLTTYNGAQYLTEQMESIRNQDLPADEVIIMDDCSTDATVQLIEGYIRAHQLTTWKLIRNESNQGWMKNFKMGFDLAQGQYIFPCDQDDVWHPDKCRKMTEEMDARPEIDLLVSNYRILFSGTDNGSRAYKRNERRMINDGKVVILPLDPKWPYIARPGCTYCFRKRFFDEIKEDWDTTLAHDAILWRYARMHKTLAVVQEPLIDFRRHGDNATTVKTRTREGRIRTFDEYLYFHRIALQECTSPREKKILEKGIRFLEKRKEMFTERKLLLIAELALCYGKYYMSVSGIAGDLYFLLKDKQTIKN